MIRDKQTSIAYLISTYIGKMSNWINILPSYESAEAAYQALPPDVQARLLSRAASHGMDPVELMQKIPEELWDDPEKLGWFLDVFDVSHIIASSVDPERQSDPGNWVWELSGPNRRRGAATMTGEEHRTAVDTADVYAQDVTGERRFFDFNGYWQEFKVTASPSATRAPGLIEIFSIKLGNVS